MEITSVSSIQTYSAGISNSNKTESRDIQEEPAVTITETADELTNTESEEVSGKGVIRNLINGHFKGVADVRLRINFSEQIAALEQAELAKATDSGLSSISETLNNEINTALGSEEIDEESAILISSALETLNNEISQIKTDSSSGDNLITALRASFDSFVLTARPVAVEPAVEEPISPKMPASDETILSDIETTEELVVPDAELPADEIPSEETPLFSIDQFLTDLIATFDSEIGILETSLANSSVLPEISEPNGNGRAFDKFMTIYNDMKNSKDTESEIIQSNDIDLIT